jgi:hypothetical protein
MPMSALVGRHHFVDRPHVVLVHYALDVVAEEPIQLPEGLSPSVHLDEFWSGGHPSGQAGFSGAFMEGREVAEVDESRRELGCNDTLHDLGLSAGFTGATCSRQACTTGVLIGVGC